MEELFLDFNLFFLGRERGRYRGFKSDMKKKERVESLSFVVVNEGGCNKTQGLRPRLGKPRVNGPSRHILQKRRGHRVKRSPLLGGGCLTTGGRFRR